MEQEFINNTLGLFEKPEKWNSFLELASMKDKIANVWNSRLKDEIESKIKLDNAWEFNKCGSNNSMQWFLREFGQPSLSVWLEGEYFSLWANDYYFDNSIIKEKLNEPDFKSIKEAILHKDSQFMGGYIYRERGKFEFGSPYDNKFDSNHLVWFAGNRTEDFIKQIEVKLDAFTNKHCMNLLIDLNKLSRK